MKTKTAKILLSLILAIGSLALLYSIFHPSEPENALFLGFSTLRLWLMGADLALLVLIVLVLLKAHRTRGWLEDVVLRITRFFDDSPERSDRRFAGTNNMDASFRKSWHYYLILILLTLLVFSPITYSMVFLIHSDYASHIYWAEQMKEAARPDVPGYISAHSGWQILVILIQTLTGCTFPVAGFIATLLGMTLMSLVLFSWIKPALLKQNIPLWWGIGIVMVLNLVTPVLLATPLDMRFYFGYLGINSYHNPTIILLRPFAILQFIFTIRGLREETSPWLPVIFAAIVSMLAAFIKPVFAICILPAAGVIIAYRLLRKTKLNWKMLIIGLFLPTMIILTWQFLLSYSSGVGSGILFSPLTVMRQYSGYLSFQLLLSILFPLCITILYYKKASKDIGLVLGWLVFGFGAFFTYFMAESGARFFDGNFTWCGEIATLTLFFISTLFFIEQIRGNRFKVRLLKIIWALHGLSGIIYYCSCLLLRSYM